MKLIILRGLPASGKSTFARQLEREKNGRVIVSRDALRLTRPIKTSETRKDYEGLIRVMRDNSIAAHFESGFDVISDDTNIEPTQLARLREIAAQWSAEVEIIDSFLNVPVDVCIERDSKRDKPVGAQVIRKMAKRLEAVKALEKRLPKYLPYDSRMQDAILVDLDGTAALIWSRDPYDAARCEEDKPNKPVWDCISAMVRDGKEIIFMSGRSEDHKAQTVRWLNQHWNDAVLSKHWEEDGKTAYKLYMRASGDTRSDVEVKRDLFNAHIRNRYNVLFALDDRDSVVALWREIGVPCFQVNYGDF